MNTFPSLLTILDELIAIPSVSSTLPDRDMGNRPIIDKLANLLTDLNFRVNITPLGNKKNKANLIAKLGNGSGGLILSGHTDTVPYDEHLWQYNPLSLTQKDNKLFGLGTADMKGFFPIIIEAAKMVANQPLRHPLIIIATADEESSMCGARNLAEQKQLKASAAVIGEPTELKPIYMHKGVMIQSVTIEGRGGHSSNPALGRNAIEAMHAAITEIMSLRDTLQKHHNTAFTVPTPTINIGCIHGGDSPNRICSECEVHFDLRILPGMSTEAVYQQLQNQLTPLENKFDVRIHLRSLMPSIPSFHQPRTDELVQVAERLTGQHATSACYATEGPFLRQLDIDTIIMGPGSINQAHQPNEYLAIDQIQPAINLYKKLIQHYCL